MSEDLARLIYNFDSKKDEYLKCQTVEEKKQTRLYKHVYNNRHGMSVLRLNDISNQKAEILNYCETTYKKGEPIGVVFTMNGDNYVLFGRNYNSSTGHVNIVMGDNDDEIIQVCDAMAHTGKSFNYK